MKKNQASGAAFNPFDWFVVVVVLRFNGSTSCADTFLTHAHQPRTPTVSQLQLLDCFILVPLHNLGIATRRFEVGILRTSPLLLGL
eukprot:TsM_000388800 transcript=TsM_000388800 gene=TsM_000388800